MTTRFTTGNLKSVLKFPFQDAKWKSKFAILALLSIGSILIIPGFFIGGYIYESMRRIIVDKAEVPTLPDWDDMGTCFKNGLRMFGVGLVYSLPTWITLLLSFAILVPLMILGSGSNRYEESLMVVGPILTGLMVLGYAAGFITQFLSITALSHMIARNEFYAAFRIREWWPILRNNLGGYVLTYLLVFGASYAMGFAIQILIFTIVLCITVPFLWLAFYSYILVICGVLFAQAYNEGVERNAAQPTPAAQPAS